MTQRPGSMAAIGFAMISALLISRPALAGPPLLCFPFAIGDARSLPMGVGSWHATDPRYDVSRLVDDTLALLTPQTPVIARMETIRRATIYAATNREAAAALLDRLKERAARPTADAPHAVFDFGYLVETYKQAAPALGRQWTIADGIDGHNLVALAAAKSGDPQMVFALAVMTRGNTRAADEHRAHLAKVVEAARTNAAIKMNIASQFGSEIDTQK